MVIAYFLPPSEDLQIVFPVRRPPKWGHTPSGDLEKGLFRPFDLILDKGLVHPWQGLEAHMGCKPGKMRVGIGVIPDLMTLRKHPLYQIRMVSDKVSGQEKGAFDLILF